jgi:UDP-GlcNAc:undecaprenyl-phosphate/decaprenyl-phosphate GlcNAc-1-phosphate transferase
VTVPRSVIAVVAAGVVAFILVAGLTEVMRRVAIRHRLVDQPRADRIHVIATPYLGGVAIAGGTVAAAAGVVHPGAAQALTIFVAAMSVSILGLLDDLRTLSQSVRLVTECLAAVGLVVVGVHVDLLASEGTVGRGLDAAFTVIWIVVITNSFNLLDNMDGAAAAIAFATTPLLAILALAGGQQAVAALLAATSAGCAGFLVHNWHPARIFMGDAGSLFLGFVISSAAVLTCGTGDFPGSSATTVTTGLLLMTFVPVVDTGTVLVSRRRAGSKWNRGGTDHIAHRLQALGLSTSRTAVMLSLATATSAALGALVVAGVVPAGGLLFGCVVVGAAVVGLAQKVEVGRPPAAGGAQGGALGASVAVPNQRAVVAPSRPLDGRAPAAKAR